MTNMTSEEFAKEVIARYKRELAEQLLALVAHYNKELEAVEQLITDLPDDSTEETYTILNEACNRAYGRVEALETTIKILTTEG
jgi:predicted site-specific integrase-resolvase